MRYALPAFLFFALVAAGAAYDARAPRRTAVPAIKLRPAPVREVKPKAVKRPKRVQRATKPRISKGSSARARLSSGYGGAGAAPAPPSPGLPAGRRSGGATDDDDNGDDDD
jgi:hypothetical protein